jgi:transposase
MGMDQHRAQISAEWIETITGEISRARIAPADRAGVRKFLARFKGADLEVALEATTGWRFLTEELQRVGADVHLAEVVQTSGLKGRGKRPKTDWADAQHLRELLLIGRLPESWIAPAHLLDLRAQVRCRHTLVHQRTEWQQRMQAVLFHHGAPHSRGLLKLENRERVAALKLPAAAREQLTIALSMIDAIDLQLSPFDLSLRDYARKQPGCHALSNEIYGIGELTSVTILAELGDTRRFQNSRDAVRYSGLDITVRESDQRRAPGHLSRQGPPALRWALYEAAQAARRPSSPDRPYYEQLAARIGSNRACIAISRKLLKRSYHLLRALGDRPWNPSPPERATAVTRQARPITMNRGQFPKPCCRPLTGDGPERPSGRNPSAGTIAVGTPVARRPPHRSQRARQVSRPGEFRPRAL